jgi:hypothetical protein
VRINALMPLLIGASLCPILALGHHSHSNIDPKNSQQHSGVVTEYGWSMPHVFLQVRAPNPRGEVVEYSIELLHPPGMLERGWDADTFKPGDPITWEGAADRNPDRYYSGLTWAEKADGTRLSTAAVEFKVAPSTDFTGLWKRDLRGERPHYFPPGDWPYSPAGQAMVAQFNEDQNPMIECLNPGPPKYMLLPYPIKISRPDEHTILMHGELRAEPRVVHLTSELPAGPASTLGQSVGRIEDEQLVVETSHFAPDRWGMHTGVDSSNQKYIVERYSLSNGGLSLDIEFTVTDPVYLSESVTFNYHLSKLPDRELIDVACTSTSARLFLEGGFVDDRAATQGDTPTTAK